MDGPGATPPWQLADTAAPRGDEPPGRGGFRGPALLDDLATLLDDDLGRLAVPRFDNQLEERLGPLDELLGLRDLAPGMGFLDRCRHCGGEIIGLELLLDLDELAIGLEHGVNRQTALRRRFDLVQGLAVTLLLDGGL